MSGITLTEVDDATISTPASGKATVFLDDVLGPAYKDDAGAVHTFVGADAPALTYQDHGNTGATETVDSSAADVHRLVGNAATVTLTLSGAPASGTPAIVQLILIQDGTGGRDWAFPGSVVWGDPGQPVWTTRAANAVDMVSLETVDGGTTWYASLDGRAGPAGLSAVSIDYTFSTTTTDADPGAGFLRLSNATQNAATVIRADLADLYGATVTTTLDSLDDSTNTVKGHVRLFKKADPTKWLLFTLASIATPSGYRNITVANVGSSASSPFANNDVITLAFTRAGDVGASGTASVGTDPIFDAKGDLAVGTGADTASKLTVGANGTRPEAASGESTGIKWSYPPGYEFDYAQRTSNASITATSAGTADTVITGNAVTYDGSTVVIARFSTVFAAPDSGAAGRDMTVSLFEGATEIARLTFVTAPATNVNYAPQNGEYRFTPTAGSHTYTVKAFVSAGTGTIGAGSGGAAAAPAFLRITKA